ncbi:hypothetical protein ACQKP0_13435 [Heyndrickxia sp. NPDC080065]|uniref:hypothetical protein n=1 Tax=Heyndrickxia sp. NPDC080065 TaxID=3390568 RepID=UPI003CFD4C17
MKKLAIVIVVFVVFLSGCHLQSSTNVKQKQNKKAPVMTTEEIKREQQAAKDYFEKMILAVNEHNKEQFLSFQNDANKLFCREQEAWLLGVMQKRKEGWNFDEVIKDINISSPDKGSIELEINMKKQKKKYSNHITYPIIKIDGNWKMDDLPFMKRSDGPIQLYYLPSLKNQAEAVLADVRKIVNVYMEKFPWDPKEVNIKLYDSLEELSASVPWESLYGVSLSLLSLKFLVETNNTDITFGLMKHEVVHTMLAEITNDNAPNFMQEGLAMFISDAITKEPSGEITFNLEGASTERETILLKNIKSFKPISYLNTNYTDGSIDIYSLGYLVTNYLITTFGLDKYLEMLSELKKEDIIENDNENKEKIIFKRAINAMEKTYGPIDKLSKAYAAYYNKKKLELKSNN